MLLQIVGSLLVLTAFCALSTHRTQPSALPYLLANTLGAALLAIDAFHLRQWGFLALEATWAVVSATALAQRGLSPRRGRPR